jgi:hypothetical protein
VAATTVFSTPDDGRRKRPKHVVILQLLINNTAKFLSNNQPDALISLNIFIYFPLSTCFERSTLIFRRD